MYPLGDTINLSTPWNSALPLVYAAPREQTKIVQALPDAGIERNVPRVNGANSLHATWDPKVRQDRIYI
jgi:hypothetical protein